MSLITNSQHINSFRGQKLYIMRTGMENPVFRNLNTFRGHIRQAPHNLAVYNKAVLPP